MGGEPSGAVLSACGRYRHVLWRTWDESKPVVAFCGLNPSTADASSDDPTMRREIGFAKSWGYGGLVKVNAYDFRATDPRVLRKTPFPYSGENLGWVLEAALDSDRFVCCWGVQVDLPVRGRQAHLVERLLGLGITLWALELTHAGNPRHTLYLKGNLNPFVWKRRDTISSSGNPTPAVL